MCTNCESLSVDSFIRWYWFVPSHSLLNFLQHIHCISAPNPSDQSIAHYNSRGNRNMARLSTTPTNVTFPSKYGQPAH